MKYSGDTDFYKIDTLTVKSNFQAERGTVDPAKMSVKLLAGELKTAAINQ